MTLVDKNSLKEDSTNFAFVVMARKCFGIRDQDFMLIVCGVIGFEPGTFFFDLVPNRAAIIQRVILGKTEEVGDHAAVNGFVKVFGVGVGIKIKQGTGGDRMMVGDEKKIILKHVVGMVTGFVPETFDVIGAEITLGAIISAGKKILGEVPVG